jgi:alkyl hydroperoxide reductase subunit AhpC
MICSEHLVRVYEQQDQLAALDVEVVMISFGTPAQARFWELETGVKFQMLFDPDQLVYKAYETERSFWRSWGLASILEFIRLLRAGRRWRGVQGDSAQLGGDFLVDQAGLIQYAHYSMEPVDRPNINDIIEHIHSLPKPAVEEEE